MRQRKQYRQLSANTQVNFTTGKRLITYSNDNIANFMESVIDDPLDGNWVRKGVTATEEAFKPDIGDVLGTRLIQGAKLGHQLITKPLWKLVNYNGATRLIAAGLAGYGIREATRPRMLV
jgi:hypothetical protein